MLISDEHKATVTSALLEELVPWIHDGNRVWSWLKEVHLPESDWDQGGSPAQINNRELEPGAHCGSAPWRSPKARCADRDEFRDLKCFQGIGTLQVSRLQWNPRQWHVSTVFTHNVFLPSTVPVLLLEAPDCNPPARAACWNMNGYFTWELIWAPRRDSCMTMRSVSVRNPTFPVL